MNINNKGKEMKNEQRIRDAISEAAQAIQTDKFSLDEEFEKQSLLYLNYSAYLADIKLERDLRESDLNTLVRTEFLEKSKKAPSEAYVTSKIENDKEYILLTYYINRLEGILKSLEHKKIALQELCQLHNEGYYSNPKQ